MTSSVRYTNCRGDIKSYWTSMTKYKKQTTICRKRKFEKKNIKNCHRKNEELQKKHEENQET